MEAILAGGATELLKKLAGVVAQEIGLAWGVKDDLKKLQKTLQMILAVITDAERKQVRDKAVRLWLGRLKHVAYDADDVMDEFAYETMRRRERGNGLKPKVLDFVSSSNPLAFSFIMAKKIKDINRSLDEITKDMLGFQFQITTQSNTEIGGERREERNRHTTSLSSESDIVGREEDKNNLINILTKVASSSTTSDRNSEDVSVVSLVGMGGLGKTTLAQLIYADELIKMQFELTMWVHVSEYFDVENLLIKIIESTTQNKFDNGLNLDVLVKKVQENLRSKKYFLVLDDLWNEDQDQWDRLKSVLLVGAHGSTILITTRTDQVASIVSGTIPPYNLKELSDDICWFIIEKRAFSHGGALHTQEMTDIGKDIAKKCCGLPLAAKFLGSLLHSKNKQSDWISIRDDETWTAQDTQRKILPSLKLSYNNLPSHLKQCFSFCAIFPKNWVIKKETLVQLWMAEGILKEETKRLIEDFGNECFESLLWSSFFINPQKNEVGDTTRCMMHDLVHDLATDVLEEKELVSLKASDLKNVSEVRRVQLLAEDLSTTFLKSLSDAKKLRSIFVPRGSNLIPTMFSRNMYLRVLHVGNSGNSSTLKLPHLKLKLTHLRYLHLTTLKFSEAVNDRYISKLYNLETLVLTNMIGIKNLLPNIQSLRKLRHLDISSSKIEELPDSVTSLCNLQSLDLNRCKLKSLPDSATGLKSLRILDISHNPIEELPAFVTTLRNLEIMNVSYCSKLKAIPENVTSLNNLKLFKFKYCESLEALPEEFGALTQLRYLSLQGTAIKALPDSCANLINLEYLHLDRCELHKEVTNWKKLREFHYFGEGTAMGVGELVLLRSLSYWVGTREGNGIEELGKLDFLEELCIYGLENVQWQIDAKTANLEGKQNLISLGLYWGQTEDHSIEILESLQPPICLRHLTVNGYNGDNFPTWMCDPSCLPNLHTIKLKGCSSMEKLPAGIGKLSSPRLLILVRMSIRSLDVEFPCLQSLYITDCSSLIKIPLFPCLTFLRLDNINHKLLSSIERSCSSLTKLSLIDVENFEFFPLSILQKNGNLKDLFISCCKQFKGFRVNDDNVNEKEVVLFGTEVQRSSSIQIFTLRDCPVLKYLPDLQEWTSLQDLAIYGCPQVKGSLTYDLKLLSSLQRLRVDYIQRDENRGDPSDFDDMIDLLD